MTARKAFKESAAARVMAVVMLTLFAAVLVCAGAWLPRFWPLNLQPPNTPAVRFVTATPTLPHLTLPSASPTPVPTPVVFSRWRGAYFDTPTLPDEPALTRSESALAFDWGEDAPAPELPADNFSARWTTRQEIPAGVYRLTARFDNGARLWVDDTLIIDEWRNGPIRSASAYVHLAAGVHSLKMAYYHVEGPAVAQLEVAYLAAFPDWQAAYFDQPDFNSPPVVIRNEAEIDYDWGAASPIPSVIPADRFAARWSRSAGFEAGVYLFQIEAEGRVRLWLDGQPLLESWDETALRRLEAKTGPLEQGRHEVRVEYVKERGQALIRVNWRSLRASPLSPLAVIVGPSWARAKTPLFLTARDSTPAEGHRLAGFKWELGDGRLAHTPEVTHAYAEAGVYRVNLTVADDRGASDTTAFEIEVEDGDPSTDGAPPIAIIHASSKAQVGHAVTLDAGRSISANPIVSFAWDFGDGVKANAVRVQHTYLVSDTYEVTLTLTDNQGLKDKTRARVEIKEETSQPTAHPDE
jgi:chitodextrinase